MADKLTEDDIALLREPQLGHLATHMEDGAIQITPVWVDTDGEAVLFNTAKGRLKERNIARDPRVTVSVADKADDYRWVVVRGTATVTEDGADDHIDRLAKKYLGVDSYPMRKADETRVTVRVIPEHRTSMA